MVIELTHDELERIKKYYIIAKGVDDDGCGTTYRVVALSGSRIAFNIEMNYRVELIRLDEFCRVCGVIYGTASGWVMKKKIDSKLIDGHRWLYVESVVNFLKAHSTIRNKQCEDFDRRLIVVYEAVKRIMEKETLEHNLYLRVL